MFGLLPMNKKGGIPAVSEIVTTVIGIIPTPIKLLLFILLVGVIATFVIPALLNMFGYACVLEGNSVQLYQIPMSNLPRKTILDVNTFLDSIVLTSDTLTLPEELHPNGDKRFARVREECLKTVTINDSQVTGYTSACIRGCDSSGFLRLYGNNICLSDGDNPPDRISYITQPYSGYCALCAPYEGYYYNHSNCFGQDVCYFTIQNESNIDVIGDNYADFVYYENILSLGGVKRQQDSTEIMNIQCVDVNQPSLFFFTIELFDKTMWVFLIVAGALIGFAFEWYNVTL